MPNKKSWLETCAALFFVKDEDLLSMVFVPTDEDGNAVTPALMQWVPVRSENVPDNLRKIEPFPKEDGKDD